MGLTSLERQIMSQFLDDLDERMGNAGCNDFTMPNTPENKEFLKEVARSCFNEQELPEQLSSIDEQIGDKLMSIDSMVFYHLRQKMGL